MITSRPTGAQLILWKKIWLKHKNKIEPNRRTGKQLVEYIHALYELEEINDPEILDVISGNVTDSPHYARKLPKGEKPEPKAFYVLRSGNGTRLYENRSDVFAGEGRILVGIDLTSGCFHVEGSEWLWDELCAYQGVDADDLENYVVTAQYVLALEQCDRIIGCVVHVTVDRPMGSSHPKHNDMIYPLNYGFVPGVMAGDGDEQDAYIMGVDHPVESFCGRVIAVVHRRDDVESKWVIAPDGAAFSADQIADELNFQEQYFDSYIVV